MVFADHQGVVAGGRPPMDGPRIVPPAKFADAMKFVIERPLPQLATLDQIACQEMVSHPAGREPSQPRINENLAGHIEQQSAFDNSQRKPRGQSDQPEFISTPPHEPNVILARSSLAGGN